ncbi:cytochrome b561 domain-containing protein [Lautropia mirabilis]
MLDFLHLPPWLLAQLTRWLDWLRAPLHTGPLDDVNPVDFWHGVLMGTAGAVLVPVAVLAARYWKIVPGQDWPRIINHRGWQRVHGLCGVAAVLCLVAGVAMAFQGMSLASHLAHPHAWMGWGVMAVLLLLVVNIALRGSIGGPGRHQPRTLVHLHDVPGDHYDMTRRRRIFEHGHRWLGYGLMLALFANVMTGYWHVNVPRGLAVATLAWWACLALMAWRWERQGRAVDGYQARWGPSMAHPGNRIPRLGGGLHRYTEEEYRRLSWGGQVMRRRQKRTTRRRRSDRQEAARRKLEASERQEMFTATQVSVPEPTTETLPLPEAHPEAPEQVSGHDPSATESRSGQDTAR